MSYFKIFKLFIFFFISLTTAFCQQDTLRVAVYEKPPFAIGHEDGSYEGLMIDLWKNIAKDLNLKYSYESVDMETLINGIHNGNFDIGLGAISVTPEREYLVDFTHAVNPSGTTIAVAHHKNILTDYDRFKIFLRLISILFLSLLLIFLLTATIVWLIERKKIKKLDQGKQIKTFKDGLWWSAITMTTIGHNDNLPMSRLGKAIGFAWVFITIVFVSLFTANASAKLSNVDKSLKNYTTKEDLQNKNVVAVANSSGEAYLQRENISYKQVATLDQALNLVIDEEDDVIVYNAPVLNYYNNRIRVDELDVLDDYLLKNNMAIALQPNSPFKEQINISLLEHITEPKWQQALYENIGNRKPK